MATSIQDIHTKVLEAVKQNPESLDMRTWHTCETTHCRAGWVTHLAGERGRELERRTSYSFAAMVIYKNSSPIMVAPTQFYKNNDEAMADIERCAEEEKKAKA